MDVLNLAGADLSIFEAMKAGVYPATVFEVTDKETKGGEGAKLPAGIPMWNVHFRIADGHEYENRRVFKTYVIAPATLDGEPYKHKKMMDSQILKFLVDIGYDEKQITSGKFKPDFDDMEGRPVAVVVSRKQKYGTPKEADEWQNDVEGTKPIAALAALNDSSGIL